MNVLVTVQVERRVDLAEFLAKEVARTSLRDVQAKTGVSKTAIQNIIKGNTKQLPELETLERFAKAYSLPLWRILQMASVNLGLTNADGTPLSAEQMAIIDAVIATTTPEEYAEFLAEVRREMQRDPGIIDALWSFLRGRRSLRQNGDSPA